MFELKSIISHLINQERNIYRAEIPVLYIGNNKLETFLNSILVIDNSIQSLNMPGCMAVGENIESAFSNYVFALIESTDIRYKSKMPLMCHVTTMQLYDLRAKDVERNQVLALLYYAGWNDIYECHKNTILLKKNNKVAFTLPRTEMINRNMDIWFNKLIFQISKGKERDLYG